METIKLGNKDYPKLLAKIYDPPVLLYLKGRLVRELNSCGHVTIAIVGARQSTRYGEDVAFELAKELSQCGVTIVSGLAGGIDSAAHRGGLEGEGKTIGVLGCGIDVIYPPTNESLYQQVAEEGSLVTEYPAGTSPDSWHFPARNRIISGLSRGVVVVEGGRQSGALITADFALEQGREVFAVPGSVRSGSSRAPHELIKSGASLVEDVFDILDELNIPHQGGSEYTSSFKAIKKATMGRLSNDEKKIFSLIDFEPRHIDEIIRFSGLQTSSVSSILVMLELKKLIAQDAGKRYYRLI